MGYVFILGVKSVVRFFSLGSWSALHAFFYWELELGQVFLLGVRVGYVFLLGVRVGCCLFITVVAHPFRG